MKPLKLTQLKILERDIVRQIRDYLNIKGIFHWKNFGGPMGQRHVPDILGVLPGGRALMIEVKKPGGKIHPGQKAFIENADRAGAMAFFAYSVDDLRNRRI